MFSRVRFDRKFIFGALAIIFAAVWLTLAPGARAQNNVPDAMPTGTETVLYSFGVGPTPDKCKINDGADPQGIADLRPRHRPAVRPHFDDHLGGQWRRHDFPDQCQTAPATSSITFSPGAKTDGNDPRHNAMTLVGTVLYGTTLTGGKHDNGSIFSINDDGTGYSSPLLFNFPASATNNSGDQPHSCFVAAGSVLYGMTSRAAKGRLDRRRHHLLVRHLQRHLHAPPLLRRQGRLRSARPAHSRSQRQHVLRHDARPAATRMSASIFSFGLKKHKFKVLHHFACPGNNTPMCIDSQRRRDARSRHARAKQLDPVRLDDLRRQIRQRRAFFDPYRRQAFQNSAELRQARAPTTASIPTAR